MDQTNKGLKRKDLSTSYKKIDFTSPSKK